MISAGELPRRAHAPAQSTASRRYRRFPALSPRGHVDAPVTGLRLVAGEQDIRIIAVVVHQLVVALGGQGSRNAPLTWAQSSRSSTLTFRPVKGCTARCRPRRAFSGPAGSYARRRARRFVRADRLNSCGPRRPLVLCAAPLCSSMLASGPCVVSIWSRIAVWGFSSFRRAVPQLIPIYRWQVPGQSGPSMQHEPINSFSCGIVAPVPAPVSSFNQSVHTPSNCLTPVQVRRPEDWPPYGIVPRV